MLWILFLPFIPMHIIYEFTEGHMHCQSQHIIARFTLQQKRPGNEVISKGLMDTIMCPIIQKILAFYSMTYKNPAV